MCNNAIYDIVIYDVYGRMLQTEKRKSQIGQSQIEINISHLPNGVYGISVISEGRVIGNSKIVKQ
jgi:hypothetical protein